MQGTLPRSPPQVSPQPSLLELNQQGKQPEEEMCPPQGLPAFASGGDASVSPISKPDQDPTPSPIDALFGDEHMSPANVVERPRTSISQVFIDS